MLNGEERSWIPLGRYAARWHPNASRARRPPSLPLGIRCNADTRRYSGTVASGRESCALNGEAGTVDIAFGQPSSVAAE